MFVSQSQALWVVLASDWGPSGEARHVVRGARDRLTGRPATAHRHAPLADSPPPRGVIINISLCLKACIRAWNKFQPGSNHGKFRFKCSCRRRWTFSRPPLFFTTSTSMSTAACSTLVLCRRCVSIASTSERKHASMCSARGLRCRVSATEANWSVSLTLQCLGHTPITAPIGLCPTGRCRRSSAASRAKDFLALSGRAGCIYIHTRIISCRAGGMSLHKINANVCEYNQPNNKLRLKPSYHAFVLCTLLFWD